MRKISIIIGIILLIGLVVGAYYLGKQHSHTDIKVQIDTIEHKIDSIKIINDTLEQIVNKSETIVLTIEKQYEKDYNCIVNADLDSLCKFYAEYLASKNNRRFSSSDN